MDEDIREGLALAKALMHGTDDFVAVIDRRGAILDVNQTVAQRLGRSRSSIVGCLAYDLFPPALASRRMAAFERVAEGGKIERFEDENEGRFFDHIVYPILGPDGKVEKVVSIARDITERKRGEEALRASEKKFRELITNMEEVLYTVDREGRITFVSPSVEAMTRYRDDEIIGRHIEEFILKDDLPRLHQDFRNFLTGTGNSENEYRMVTKGGEIRWMLTHSSLIQEGAEVVGVQGIISDITERRRAEEALRESEKNARRHLAEIEAIYRSAHVGMCIIDRDLRYFRVNERLAEMNGLSVEENLGKTVREVVPDLADAAERMAGQVFRTGEPILNIELSGTTRSRPGVVRHWIQHWLPFKDDSGEVIGINVAMSEITERKRMEEALKASEARYRHLVKHAPAGIYEVDFINKRLKSVNDVMCRALGYTEEELLSMDPLDLIDDEGKKKVQERIMRGLRRERLDETVECRIIARDGRKIWSALNNAFTYEEGRITGSLVVAYDISERKKAEELLRRSQAELARINQIMSGILEHTHMMAALLDSRFHFVWVNRAYAAACRHDPSFFPGKNHFELYPHEENRSIFQRVVDTGEPFFIDAKAFEHPDQPERGVTYWDWSLVPVKDAEGGVSHLVFTLMEVTERVKAQEALRKARDQLELRVRERTAELERRNRELQDFAFIASHDLSEPLRKVQTFGSLLQERSVGLGEREKGYVLRMTEGAGRMKELLDALLRYTSVEANGQELTPVDLNDIMKDALADLELAVMDTGARVEIGPLPSVRGDPNQLRQLFQNLIANAIKYRRPGTRPFIHVFGEEEPGASRIFVNDNGIGFDERYLEKIFQPFQRLHGKYEYPGTGIGLAICRKIVERHGGTITARSTPGRGSTFIMGFPVNSNRGSG